MKKIIVVGFLIMLFILNCSKKGRQIKNFDYCLKKYGTPFNIDLAYKKDYYNDYTISLANCHKMKKKSFFNPIALTKKFIEANKRSYIVLVYLSTNYNFSIELLNGNIIKSNFLGTSCK